MSPKKLALFLILAIASSIAGAVFGLLDIFGFVDGRHALSFTLLVTSALLTYIILVTVFLLNFAQKNRIHVFLLIAAALFGITFTMMNLNIIPSLIATVLYLTFLYYVYNESTNRSQLFIKFSPKELFFPVLRSSFTFFLVLLSLLSFAQSQKLVSENSLVSANVIDFISRPTILMVNQQLNSQISGGASGEILQAIPTDQKQRVIQRALKQTLVQMSEQGNGTIYGFTSNEIPIHLAEISDSGRIDIAPVVQAMLPAIAEKINDLIQEYAVIAPLAVGILTFLILQPLIIPLSMIESLITLILFHILLSTGFIQIKTEQRQVQVPTL